MLSALRALEKSNYNELPLYDKRLFWTFINDIMQQHNDFFEALLNAAIEKVENPNKKVKIITDERVKD